MYKPGEEATKVPPARTAPRDESVPMPPADSMRQVALACLIYALGAVGILVLLRPTLQGLIETWTVSATYRHCFLIGPIVAYLIVERKARLRAQPCRPSLLGLAGFALVLVIWRLGVIGHVRLLEELALIGMLQMLWLAVFGRAWFRAALFPLAYMAWLVPFGAEMVPWLQQATARLAVSALQWTNVPVFLDGTLITIPAGSFEVAEACAGLRFLVVTVALATLVAGELAYTWPRRLVFLAAALAVPILANAVRVYGIIMIADLVGYQYATGVDHLVYGWIFLTLVLAALLGIALLLAPPGSARKATPVPPPRPGASTRAGVLLGSALMAALCLGMTALAAARAPAREASLPAQTARVGPPASFQPASWRPTPVLAGGWHPLFDRPAAETEIAFARAGVTAEIYLAAFDGGRSSGDVTSSDNRPEGNHQEIVKRAALWLSLGTERIPFTKLTVTGPAGARTVWLSYWIDDRYLASRVEAALWQLWLAAIGSKVHTGVLVLAIEDAGLGERSADGEAAALLSELPQLLQGPAIVLAGKS